MIPDPDRSDDLPSDRRRRGRMVRDQLAGCPDPRVVAAMAHVPRHRFVPAELRAAAYDDTPRPIGRGQTISQPRLVAAMLAHLAIRPGDAVLDVGAGSGYTAALLAWLVGPAGRVVAVERQGALVAGTRARLAHLAPLVDLRHGDGLAVAAEAGPFTAIHVACAFPEPPLALAGLLAPGGRLIAPVGGPDRGQRLWLVAEGVQRWLDEVLFVPGLPGTAD